MKNVKEILKFHDKNENSALKFKKSTGNWIQNKHLNINLIC